MSFLALLHSALGNKWCFIARYFRTRTDNDCKNIFHSALRSKKAETNQLLRAYAQAVGPSCDDPLVRARAYQYASSIAGGAPDAGAEAGSLAALALAHGSASHCSSDCPPDTPFFVSRALMDEPGLPSLSPPPPPSSLQHDCRGSVPVPPSSARLLANPPPPAGFGPALGEALSLPEPLLAFCAPDMLPSSRSGSKKEARPAQFAAAEAAAVSSDAGPRALSTGGPPSSRPGEGWGSWGLSMDLDAGLGAGAKEGGLALTKWASWNEALPRDARLASGRLSWGIGWGGIVEKGAANSGRDRLSAERVSGTGYDLSGVGAPGLLGMPAHKLRKCYVAANLGTRASGPKPLVEPASSQFPCSGRDIAAAAAWPGAGAFLPLADKPWGDTGAADDGLAAANAAAWRGSGCSGPASGFGPGAPAGVKDESRDWLRSAAMSEWPRQASEATSAAAVASCTTYSSAESDPRVIHAGASAISDSAAALNPRPSDGSTLLRPAATDGTGAARGVNLRESCFDIFEALQVSRGRGDTAGALHDASDKTPPSAFGVRQFLEHAGGSGADYGWGAGGAAAACGPALAVRPEPQWSRTAALAGNSAVAGAGAALAVGAPVERSSVLEHLEMLVQRHQQHRERVCLREREEVARGHEAQAWGQQPRERQQQQQQQQPQHPSHQHKQQPQQPALSREQLSQHQWQQLSQHQWQPPPPLRLQAEQFLQPGALSRQSFHSQWQEEQQQPQSQPQMPDEWRQQHDEGAGGCRGSWASIPEEFDGWQLDQGRKQQQQQQPHPNHQQQPHLVAATQRSSWAPQSTWPASLPRLPQQPLQPQEHPGARCPPPPWLSLGHHSEPLPQLAPYPARALPPRPNMASYTNCNSEPYLSLFDDQEDVDLLESIKLLD